MAPRPNGRPTLARSQDLKSMRRLVTTAIGTIGRPEMRASVTMPRPATRATFGTSAVIATVAPPSSSRRSAIRALAPPFSRTFSPRAPEPRIGSMPSRASAVACNPASRWRDTIAATRRHVGGAGERQHDVLAVPHRDDGGMMLAEARGEVGGLDDEAVEPAHPFQIMRRARSRARCARKLSSLAHAVRQPAFRCSPAGAIMRCRWTMK